jgi:hypothetical protein
MRTQSVSVTGVAASDPLLLDPYSSGQPPTVYIDIGAGCTVTVQITPDDPSSGGAVWYSAPVAALVGATTDIAASLGAVARGLRLNQTVGAAATGLKVVSAGIR